MGAQDTENCSGLAVSSPLNSGTLCGMESGWRKWRSKLLLVLMAAALGLLWLAQRVTLPPVFWYGMAILGGLAVVALGVDDIRTRRSAYLYDEGARSQTYYGLSAMLWGVFWVLVGGGMVVGALVLWMGLGQPLLDWLRLRPGPALILAGLMLVLYGLPSFLGAVEERGSAGVLLASLPGRLFNLALVAAGLAAIGLGVWELVAPDAYDALWQGMTGLFWPIGNEVEP